MMKSHENITKNHLPLKAISEKYEVAMSTLRGFVQSRHKNGFAECLVPNPTNRIIIDVDIFDKWFQKRHPRTLRRSKPRYRGYNSFTDFIIDRDQNGPSEFY